MPEQFTWTAADGRVIDFNDEAAGYSVLADGTRGLRSVPWEFSASTYAGIDGESVQNIRAGAGQITLGLMVRADNETDFRQRVRGLVRAMRPSAGPGVLTVITETGEARHLNCYGAGGLEGDEAVNQILPGSWWRVALKLYAPDPWWYGELRTLSFGLGAPNVFFPFFPVTLSPSTVQGAFTVDLSDADAPTYPLWTIRGPGSELVLTNETTGLSLAVDVDLAPGELLVIDTRPGMQSVKMSTGTNLMGSVIGDPALWPLIEDVNFVSATMTGAASASRITADLIPRYAGI